MELNVDQNFVDLDGNAILEEDGKPFTLKNALVRSLISVFEDEKSLKGEEKFKRGELASQIYRCESVIEVKVEELSLLKGLVAKSFGALIVWQAWKMLEKS